MRSRIEEARKRWETHEKPSGLLIAKGLDLAEAEALVTDSAHLVDGSEYTGVREFVEQSRAHHAAADNRSRRKMNATIGVLAIATQAALVGAVYGFLQNQKAQKQLGKALFAEGLAWQLHAEVAEERNFRYPDTLLYAAKAIGYVGQGLDEGELVPGVTPFIRKDQNPESFQKVTDWIESHHGFRPVWSEDLGSPIVDIDVSSHGRYLIAAGTKGSKRWDFAKNGADSDHLSAQAVAMHPGGERFAVADETGVSVFENGSEVSRFKESVTALAYNLSGDRLAAARPDGTIILLGDRLIEIGKAGGSVDRLAFGPKDATLAAQVSGSTLCLYFHHDRAAHLSWSTYTGEVTSFAYQPDALSDRIAVGFANGSIAIHRISDAELVSKIVVPERHSGPVTSLSWQLGGQKLVSGGADGLVRLWDSEQPVPRLIASLTGHSGPVSDVVFLQATDLIASGSNDGTAKL